jgi:hypothetical protein
MRMQHSTYSAGLHSNVTYHHADMQHSDTCSMLHMLCVLLQILDLEARSQHALLHFVSAYTSDAICGHAWLDSRNVVLLHETGVQELLSVAGAPVGTLL